MRRRQFTLVATVSIIGAFTLTSGADQPSAVRKPYTPTSFHRLVNKISVKYRRYENDADKKLKLAALKDALKRETDDLFLQFGSTVAQVKWSRGTASIYTAVDPRHLGRSTPQSPIAMKRSAPLYVPMSEVEAAAIKLGTPITVRAKLSYQSGIRLPLIGDPKLGQPIYDLNSTQMRSGSLGYYTTKSFSVDIGKRSFEVGR